MSFQKFSVIALKCLGFKIQLIKVWIWRVLSKHWVYFAGSVHYNWLQYEINSNYSSLLMQQVFITRATFTFILTQRIQSYWHWKVLWKRHKVQEEIKFFFFVFVSKCNNYYVCKKFILNLDCSTLDYLILNYNCIFSSLFL